MQMRIRGEGVKKSENFADIICTWPLSRLVRASECAVYLLIRVEGIDVLDGRGEQLRREFRRHPDWQRHPALQRGVRRGAVVVHIVVVADLKHRQLRNQP